MAACPWVNEDEIIKIIHEILDKQNEVIIKPCDDIAEEDLLEDC